MPYNNQCQDCRSRGSACTTHRGSTPSSTYDSGSTEPGVFVDSSGHLAIGSATGVGVDTTTGGITIGGVDTSSSCDTSSSFSSDSGC